MEKIKILEELVSAIECNDVYCDLQLNKREDGSMDIQFTHWDHIYPYDHRNIYFYSFYNEKRLKNKLELALQVIEGKAMIKEGWK